MVAMRPASRSKRRRTLELLVLTTFLVIYFVLSIKLLLSGIYPNQSALSMKNLNLVQSAGSGLVSLRGKIAASASARGGDVLYGVHMASNLSGVLDIQNFVRSHCSTQTNQFYGIGKAAVELCIKGSFPPFKYTLPNFVRPDDERIFLLQKKNRECFDTNWIDWQYETCVTIHPAAKNVLHARIQGYDAWSFQHFHDNALPWIYQVRQIMDVLQNASTCRFEEHLQVAEPPNDVTLGEWQRLGFARNSLDFMPRMRQLLLNGSGRDFSLSIPNFPKDYDQVRVHPQHVTWLRNSLGLGQRERSAKTVYWISRKEARQGRRCSNEEEVVEALKRNGVNTIFFDLAKASTSSGSDVIEDLMALLDNACAIVGVHGGGLYNQYFAPATTALVELIPIQIKNDLFHDQFDGNVTAPRIASRAFWHNSQLIGQPYWRIHARTESDRTFALDSQAVKDTVAALQAAGCAFKGSS
jgi:hypothetical protein